jgi:WXG100 family type VII secretion target
MSGNPSDLVHVNFAGMETVQGDLRASLGKFQEAIRTLDTEIRKHLAEWEGGARDAYNTSQARWNAAADQMAILVNDLHGTVANVKEIHAQAERVIQASWE